MTVAQLKTHMDAGFTSVDRRFAAIDRRFAAIDRRLNSLEEKMDSLASLVRTSFSHLTNIVDTHERHLQDLHRRLS